MRGGIKKDKTTIRVYTDDLAFKINRFQIPDYNHSVHSHNFHELVVILDGEGTHIIEGREYQICSGDICVLMGNQKHSFRDVVNIEMINIGFFPSKLSLPTNVLKKIPGYNVLFTLEPYLRNQHFKSHLRLDIGRMKHVDMILKRLEDEFNKKTTGYEAMIRALFLELIVYLSRSYGAEQREKQWATIYDLGETLSYISNHYQLPLTIEFLAKRNNMSKSHFMRIFRNVTGLSPIKYILRERISNACEKLKNSTQPIAEIAWSSGFQDSNYFARQFKKSTGLSPKNYRAI